MFKSIEMVFVEGETSKYFSGLFDETIHRLSSFKMINYKMFCWNFIRKSNVTQLFFGSNLVKNHNKIIHHTKVSINVYFFIILSNCWSIIRPSNLYKIIIKEHKFKKKKTLFIFFNFFNIIPMRYYTV